MNRRMYLLSAVGAALVAGASWTWPSGGAGAAGSGTGVIVTDRNGQIVLVNADGSGARAVTHPAASKYESDEEPVPSPDGTLIAFTRESFVGDELREDAMLVRSDGSDLLTLAEVPSDAEPAWSPDGSVLAIEAVNTATGRANVLLVDRKAGTRRLLFPRTAEGKTDFGWSPDGESIVCTTTGGVDVVDVQTGVERQLSAVSHPQAPAWSPDGSRIAFATSEHVFVMNADGTARRAVGPAFEPGSGGPAWSPDATRLAFTASGSRESVVVVDVLTARVTLKVPPLARGGSAAPAWAPDGERISFLRAREPDDYPEIDGDVWTIHADGSRQAQVTTAFPLGGSHSTPLWLSSATAVAADPPLAMAQLRPTASVPLGRHYTLAAVDGRSVALVLDPSQTDVESTRATLGVWSGHGPVRWITRGAAHRAALTRNRIYWSWYSSDHDGSEGALWTATLPRGRHVRLAHVKGDPGGPALLVAGDRTLVVYSLGATLWRLHGTSATRIRREHRKFLEPLSVNRGRVLLYNGHALEVVDSHGKLVTTLPAPKERVSASLSGERVILLNRSEIIVYHLHDQTPSARWPVGPISLATDPGIPYSTLFPYQTGNYGDANFRLLAVDTGHDVILGLPPGTSPTSVALSGDGLFSVATPPYRGLAAQLDFVPLATVRSALAGAAAPGTVVARGITRTRRSKR